MTDQVLRDTLIVPSWPAPAGVHAVSTTRRGGVSRPPYDSLNLGYSSGDLPAHVDNNRQRLRRTLGLTREPLWLRQVHGNGVVRAEHSDPAPEADAAWSQEPGQACVVMTADCLPVLFCDRSATRVAAAHAGWRGLAQGVIAATLQAMACHSGEVLAWLGPAIGPRVFEVGDEVRAVFLDLDSENEACFQPSPAGRWLADIYALARHQLTVLGVEPIYGGGWCTFSEKERFFSYRRDGKQTGRMASLIWLEE